MVPIIPRPQAVERAEGRLTIAGPTSVVAEGGAAAGDPAVAAVVPLVADLLAAAGLRPTDDAAAPGPAVALRLGEGAGPAGSASDERYTVEVTPEGVALTAAAPVGLLHAARALRQMVERGGDGDGAPAGGRGGEAVSLPCVVVRDAPRYPWRGLSLDVARNFFGLDALKAVVDVIGLYRMNVLHLHLTDDQGWRIESPSRPALVEKSSGTDTSGGAGGYLSTGDFRALQDYAAQRFVRVVPEIDVPGHINAATHAYGELMPDGVPTDTYTGIEVGFSKLAFDLPGTEPFLRDVFGDLAAITDDEYLHIGGDEVHKMSAEEYAQFIELCERIVLDTGKKVAAWQEVANVPVRPGTLIQYWETNRPVPESLARAAANGSRFLMSPGNRTYLDMKYTADHDLGQDWAGLIELRDSYEWDPAAVVPGVGDEAIEGVEAAVWTETLSTPDALFSMLLPRLSAVAEVAWTAPERKDWEDYRARVAVEAASWRRDGIAFHETPQVEW